MATHFILYVADQDRSTAFYRQALDREPILEVPGMTEFSLGEGVVLGLMPESGIRRLLGESLPDPMAGRGIPRAELYIHVPDASLSHRGALEAGAKELSPVQLRDWGDKVGYLLDRDGHVLAFAERSS